MLRVGVSGHRQLPDADGIGAAVRQALEQMRSSFRRDDELVQLVVVSALAEGADRLVARIVLVEYGGGLEAVLPLSPSDYRTDFASAQSRAEFDALLSRASTIEVTPAGADRTEAYARAGRRVVDRSDALIVIWDGAPARGRGGTAEVVEYARKRMVPLFWVETTGSHDLRV